jgi:flagellar biosynthesis protein FlhA
VTALVLFILAIMPGIPMLPFLAAAIGFGGAGVLSRRSHRATASIDTQKISDGTESSGSGAEGETGDSVLVLALDKASLYRVYRARAMEYAGEWREFREAFLEDTGIGLPGISVVSDDLLAQHSYSVRYMGIEMVSGEVPVDALFVEISRAQAEVLGLEVLKEEDHPTSGHRLFWTRRSATTLGMLKGARIKYHDFMGFIALRVAHSVRRHPEEFISVTHVHSMLRQIEKKHPGLVGDGFGREFVTIPKLTEILQELIRQGVSIRDFRAIMECLASYCASSGITTTSESPVDIAEAVHYIRASRRRQIVRRFIGSGQAVPVLSLSPGVEQTFEGASADRWSTSLAMAPELYDALLQGLFAAIRPTLQSGALPIALLCSREVKEKVISFVRMSGLSIFVTTLDEIDPAFPVMQMGVWDARI